MEKQGFSVQADGRRPPLSPISSVPWADDDDSDDTQENSVLLDSAINSSKDGYTALSSPPQQDQSLRTPQQVSPRARQHVRASHGSPRTPTAHVTCVECNGKGFVSQGAATSPRAPSSTRRGSFVNLKSGTNGLETSDLVTLVSASDHRLKPRRTKLIVASWVAVTLVVGTAVAYLLWPRAVSMSAPIEFSFSNFTGWTNCPPLPTNRACVDQACSISNWPDLPYCNTSNASSFNVSKCNSIKGCVYKGSGPEVNATYDDCVTCNDPKMQTQQACDPNGADTNCVWRDGLCDSSQIGPIGFVFNYTFTVVNDNYLPTSLLDGHAAVSFTDITDSGEEQDIVVFDGDFSETEVPARSTRSVVVPVNVTIDAVNFSNTVSRDKLVLKPIESLKRIILHDVCAKTAGKCGKDAGGGDLPERNQFFVSFKMNLTASTGPAKTALDQYRVIALRRHCPIQNTTTTTTTTTSSPSFEIVRTVDHYMQGPNSVDTMVADAPPLVVKILPDGQAHPGTSWFGRALTIGHRAVH
eukprot:m.117961 g.117961  ORF g.117961 m.117961 type:complete len:525 (+) comp10959_c0_seq5:282-1856(+)